MQNRWLSTAWLRLLVLRDMLSAFLLFVLLTFPIDSVNFRRIGNKMVLFFCGLFRILDRFS
jgi:hypothetical protein